MTSGSLSPQKTSKQQDFAATGHLCKDNDNKSKAYSEHLLNSLKNLTSTQYTSNSNSNNNSSHIQAISNTGTQSVIKSSQKDQILSKSNRIFDKHKRKSATIINFIADAEQQQL